MTTADRTQTVPSVRPLKKSWFIGGLHPQRDPHTHFCAPPRQSLPENRDLGFVRSGWCDDESHPSGESSAGVFRECLILLDAIPKEISWDERDRPLEERASRGNPSGGRGARARCRHKRRCREQ